MHLKANCRDKLVGEEGRGTFAFEYRFETLWFDVTFSAAAGVVLVGLKGECARVAALSSGRLFAIVNTCFNGPV